MKNKFGLIRVLAVVFALVLSISLVSCVKDEDFDAVKTGADKTQENVNQLQADIATLQKSLETITSELKNTADAAATKAALEEAKTALTKAAQDLDAKLTAAIDESVGDYTTKLNTVNEKTKALDDAQKLAEAELKAAQEKYDKYIADNDAALEAAKAELDALALKHKAEIEAITEQLVAAKTELAAADAKLTEALNAAKADYQQKIDEINTSLTKTASDLNATDTLAKENKTTIGDLQTKLAELSAKVGNLPTNETLEGYVTTEALQAYKNEVAACNYATTAYVDGKVAELTETINNKYTELNGKITALAGKVETLEGYDLSDITARLAACENKLAKLFNEDGTPKDALEEYKKVTAILNGTEKLTDENDNELKFTDTKAGKEYSYTFESFLAIATSVAEGPYDDDEIDSFNKKIETIKFFLSRATTEEEISKAFNDLAETKNNLKTLVESMQAYLDDLTLIANTTDVAAKIEKIKKAYDKLSAKGTAADLASVQDEYTLKTVAYKNYLDAVAAGKMINTTVDTVGTVVLGTSDTAISELQSECTDFKNTYFGNANYNALYGINVDDVATAVSHIDEVINALVKNKEVNGFAKRLELLNKAKEYITTQKNDGKLKFAWDSYNGSTNERPVAVGNGKDTTIKSVQDLLTAWITGTTWKTANLEADYGTYTDCLADLEDDNIEAILTGVTGSDFRADLNKAAKYMSDMVAIYEKYDVENAIIAKINALITGDVKLTAENDAAMDALLTLINNLDADIEAVTNYIASTDTNKTEMVSQAMRDNAAAYATAYDNVVAKINAVKAQFYTDGKADTTKMSFREYSKIAQFRTDIDKICDDLKTLLLTAGVDTKSVTAPEAVLIELNGSSEEIVKEGCVLYELNRAYAAYSKDAYEAWKKAKNLLDQIPNVANLKLDMGHAVYDTFKAVSDAVNDYQLLFDDQIMLMADDGTIEQNVNLKQIQLQLEQYMLKYDELAKTTVTGAEALAAQINADIETIRSLDASKMDNYKKISEVQTLMDNWFNAFCSAPAGENEAEKAASLKKMISEDLVDVPAYGLAGETYKFVDATLYDILVTKYTGAVATKKAWDAAVATWNTASVAAQTTKLHTDSLHTAALEAWDAICDLYTATLDNSYKGYAEEYDNYIAYKTNFYDVYVANCTAAVTAANEIKDLINALPSINSLTDIAYVTTADLANKLAEIDAKLAAFKATYCDGDCFFWTHEGDENNLSGINNTDGKDYILALEKVRAMYTFITKTDGMEADKVEINRKSLATALGLITEITNASEGTHERLIRNVKSQMNAYTKEVNPDYVVE